MLESRFKKTGNMIFFMVDVYTPMISWVNQQENSFFSKFFMASLYSEDSVTINNEFTPMNYIRSSVRTQRALWLPACSLQIYASLKYSKPPKKIDPKVSKDEVEDICLGFRIFF